MKKEIGNLFAFGVPASFRQISNYTLKTDFDFPVAIVDTTYRCNLNCKMCYYKRQTRNKDLSLTEWKQIFQDLYQKGIRVIVFTGGEPMLRQDVIDLGCEIFPYKVMFSNGTLPLIERKDITLLISIDGTKEYYKNLRGPYYTKLKANIAKANRSFIAAMVISKDNQECLEEYAQEWSKEKNCEGIIFDFYTPGKNEDNQLAFDKDENEVVIKRLLALKDKYADKILLSKKVIEGFAYKSRDVSVTQKCIVRRFTCLDSQGMIKKPCTMVGSDCERCYHFVPIAFYQIMMRGDWHMAKIAYKHFIKPSF